MPVDRRALARLLVMLWVAAGPLAVCSLLLAVTFGSALWHCVPYWNDEVWYWNEIAVFHRAGWSGGYTVINEEPAKTAWVQFGAHGPFFPALYGGLTRWTGLHPSSIPLLNSFLLILSGLLWALFARPRGRQAWAAVFIVTTFWPLILYLPSSMQEGLHFALAFVLATTIQWFLRNPKSWPARLALLALVLAAAQLRVTWCWLVVPLAWAVVRPWGWRRVLGTLGAAGLVVGLSFYEATLLYSPVSNFMHEVIVRATQSPLGAVLLMAKHALKNAARYLDPTRGTWLEIGLRWQVLLLCGAAAYHLSQGRRTRVPAAAALSSRNILGGRVDSCATNREAPASSADAAFGFVLLNLLCIVGFVLALYDIFDWRDYRVVAPHLLLSLLLLVGCGARQWLGGYALISLGLAVFVGSQFNEFHSQRTGYDRARIDSLARDLAGTVRFVEGASGWDNTILMHVEQLDSAMLGLPPGIGISAVYDWADQAWPARSRYILLRRHEAALLGVPRSMRKVAATQAGDVYARPCPDSQFRRAAPPRDARRHASGQRKS